MANIGQKVEYTFADMEKIGTEFSLGLPDLEVTEVYKPKDGAPYRLVKCRPKFRDYGGCPSCKNEIITVHGKANSPRYIHDVNVGMAVLDLCAIIGHHARLI